MAGLAELEWQVFAARLENIARRLQRIRGERVEYDSDGEIDIAADVWVTHGEAERTSLIARLRLLIDDAQMVLVRGRRPPLSLKIQRDMQAVRRISPTLLDGEAVISTLIGTLGRLRKLPH
jgi:hypothetical protein